MPGTSARGRGSSSVARTAIDTSEAIACVPVRADTRAWAVRHIREDKHPVIDAIVYVAVLYAGHGKSDGYLDGTLRNRVERLRRDFDQIDHDNAAARGRAFRRGHAMRKKATT